MADPASLITTPTPKRKRGVETAITPIKFTFDPSRASEEGANSPRTKVAHKFHGLDLDGEGGGGVAIGSSIEEDDARPDVALKRQRQDVEMHDGPADGLAAQENVPSQPAAATAEPTTQDNEPSLPFGGIDLPQSSPTQLSPDSKTKAVRMRSGTPPPRLRKKMADKRSRKKGDEDEEMTIVDPVRAALTWRDDEITIYDPEDADDDGTGINGVGFKPTPVMAQARLLKRRQQLADYRRREEGEARALRNQRRREQQRAGASSPDNNISPSRKVRFREDNTPFIATPSPS